MTKFTGTYTENWEQIAKAIKAKYNWQCERCFAVNDFESGHVLTIHHLDGNKSNNAEWNLACLCQRCHLHIQGRVKIEQFFMFGHTGWMKPHVEGYYKSLQLCKCGQPVEWDIEEGFCQLCFEKYCDDKYYESCDEGWVF